MHYRDVDRNKTIRLSMYQRMCLDHKYHNGKQVGRYINEMHQLNKLVYVAESPFNAVSDKKMLIAIANKVAFDRELARQKDAFNFQLHKALHEANWEYERDSDD